MKPFTTYYKFKRRIDDNITLYKRTGDIFYVWSVNNELIHCGWLSSIFKRKLFKATEPEVFERML